MALSGSLNFLSASEFGSFEIRIGDPSAQGVYVRLWGADVKNSFLYSLPENDTFKIEGKFIPTTFVGMNTNIYEPISASSNYLGYPLDLSPTFGSGRSYLKWRGDPIQVLEDCLAACTASYPNAATVIEDAEGLVACGIACIGTFWSSSIGPDQLNIGGTVSIYSSSATPDSTVKPLEPLHSYGAVLNSLLLHRNGPYQHPSWKRIRGGEHPVARYFRRNNLISIDENSPVPTELDFPTKGGWNSLQYGQILGLEKQIRLLDYDIYAQSEQNSLALWQSIKWPNNTKLKQYYEPVVVSKYKPLTYAISVGGAQGIARQSLMNQITFFTNPELNATFKISSGDTRTGSAATERSFRHLKHDYYTLFHAAKNINPAAEAFTYTERIYPRGINAYRTFKLKRPNYEETGSTCLKSTANAVGFGYTIPLNVALSHCTPVGAKLYDNKPGNKRSFWKKLQGGGIKAATSDGSTRLRTDDYALNSTAAEYKLWPLEAQSTHYRVPVTTPDLTNYQYATTQLTNTQARRLFYDTDNCPAGGGGDIPWNNTTNFIINGNVTDLQNVLSSSAFGNWAANSPKGAFVQLEAYQPFEISLLSMWPLDPRQDIYDKPVGLHSSVGGKGLQIGLTPHAGADTTTLAGSAATLDFIVLLGDGDEPCWTDTYIIMEDSAGNKVKLAFNQAVDHQAPAVFDETTTPKTLTVPIMGMTSGGEILANHIKDAIMLPAVQAYLDITAGTPVAGNAAPIDDDGDPYTITLSQGTIGFAGNTTVVIDQLGDAAGGCAHDAYAWYLYSSTGTNPTPGFQGGKDYQKLNDASLTDAEIKNGYIANLKTGSAGELVYSTKPTIFFYRTGSSATDLDGYGIGSASPQYHRHTYPYNSPFYTTNRIRGIDPFHNSYEDFFGELKHMGRDYTVVPEFNMSDHFLEYCLNDKFINMREFHNQTVFITKETELDPFTPTINLLTPRHTATDFEEGAEGALGLNHHKFNFLTVEGGAVTSSAANSYIQNESTGDLYKYLDVSDPESGSLASVTTSSVYGELYGSSTANHWARDRQSVKFAALYGETDTLKAFSNLLDQDQRGFEGDIFTIPNKIIFKCHAVKKMRIKDGFYPVTRTVQLAKEFDEAFLTEAGMVSWGGGENFIARAALDPDNKTYTDVSDPRTVNAMLRQTFLEPFFAPGILYNSIKSGIAVDWPLYASKADGKKHVPDYYRPDKFIRSGEDPFHPDRICSQASSSFNYGGMYMMGSSRCIPAILTKQPSHRLPFSALYDWTSGQSVDILTNRDIYLPSDFVDLDREGTVAAAANPVPPNANHAGTTTAAGSPGARWNVLSYFGPDGEMVQDPVASKGLLDLMKVNSLAIRSNSSINNFLCETMEFFLADAKQSIDKKISGIKFPVIIPTNDPSPIQSSDVTEEKKYFMEVGLTMGRTQVMCEGPRSAGIPGTASISALEGNKYGNTMRGYIYGPPLETVSANGPEYGAAGLLTAVTKATNASIVQSSAGSSFGYKETLLAKDDYEMYFYFNLQDPAYQAYTPPYFYGDSSKILTYAPANETDRYEDIWPVATKENAFYYERYDTGSFHGDKEALCLTLPSTSSISSGSGPRMKIDASLEFSDTKIIANFQHGDPVQFTSYIAPWWTCPVLDFSSSYAAVKEYKTIPSTGLTYAGLPIPVYNTIENTYHDITTGRGMWGGYGTDPYDPAAMQAVHAAAGLEDTSVPTTKGLYITVKNIFSPSAKGEHEGTTGFVGINNQNEYQAGDTDEGDGSTTGIPGNGFFTVAKLAGTETQKSGSLAEKLGFKIDRYPIGKIASNKTVSEAIVIIPYLEDPIILSSQREREEFVEGYNINSILDGTSLDPTVQMGYLPGFPGGELYSTREIIPGKHFLPINKGLFNNILSLLLTKKYIPENKRGKPTDPTVGHPGPGGWGLPYNLLGAETPAAFDANLNAAKSTDVGKMINKIIGDLNPHVSNNTRPGQYTHNLGLQLPPEFDFVHNSAVDPFQMIILPFEHKFSKQDLTDMYQGVMPRLARFFQKAMKQADISPTAMTPTMSGDVVPSWMPYIVTNAEHGSIYKQVYQLAKAGLDRRMGEGTYEAMVESESGLFGAHEEIKRNYQEILQTFLRGAQAGSAGYSRWLEEYAGIAGATTTFDKIYLRDLGLENFLCPPLMTPGPVQENKFYTANCTMDGSNIPSWLNSSKDFYENLRFMVFKVKQRAAKDYSKYRSRQIHQVLKKQYISDFVKGSQSEQRSILGETVLENITYDEVYGSNWPYDYFSLIETIKLDISFEVFG